jgi:hypothetical protein
MRRNSEGPEKNKNRPAELAEVSLPPRLTVWRKRERYLGQLSRVVF